MESQNAIKQYKSPIEKDGGYRIYSVYQSADKFIFECWDCNLTSNDGSSVGGRKAYSEFSNLSDAVAEYGQYLKNWENIDEI